MVERKLSINAKSENNLTALRHLRRLHWFPHWPLVSATHTRRCVQRGRSAQTDFQNYAFTCLFAPSFTQLFIHLCIFAIDFIFWSGCHLLHNKENVTFVPTFEYLQVRVPCTWYAFNWLNCSANRTLISFALLIVQWHIMTWLITLSSVQQTCKTPVELHLSKVSQHLSGMTQDTVFLFAIYKLCLKIVSNFPLTVLYEYVPLCTVHVYASPSMFSISLWLNHSTTASTRTVCQLLLHTIQTRPFLWNSPTGPWLSVAAPIEEPADASFNCSM